MSAAALALVPLAAAWMAAPDAPPITSSRVNSRTRVPKLASHVRATAHVSYSRTACQKVELSVCLKFCRVLKLASPFDAEGNIHLQRPMPVAIGSMAR